MKQHLSLFVMALALCGASPVFGATNLGTRAGSSVDLTNMPATRERTKVNYEKYETRTTSKTYSSSDGKNIYYTQPVKRSELYKQYSNNNSSQNVRTSRSETVRSELKRKYFLAHPFFQPLKGKFGSVTDISYTMNSYDTDLAPIGKYTVADSGATWKTNQFSIKEDVSFGITDEIAIMGMLKYDSSKYKLEWDAGDKDTMDDNGLNMFGIGGQWRFLDNDKWIATASAYYMHQKDIANDFVLDLKAGYKVSSTTIYGLARAWYLKFDGDSYGNLMEGKTEQGNKQQIFLAYKTDVDNVFYAEGGIGSFSVLDEDWTLNLEAVFGYYDWHEQATIKGAIGWQPNDWFALNLYAKTAFYDSANGKKLDYMVYGALNTDVVPPVPVNSWVQHGVAKVDNYSETTVGVQAIFMF